MTSLFIPYGAPLPSNLKELGVRVVGINMSNPPWKDQLPEGIKLITTVDVPKEKMQQITPTIEHAWGLIMAAHRRIIGAAQDCLGDRDRWLAPWQLSGAMLGIIGYGRIGKAVAKVGRAFGMTVQWSDPAAEHSRKPTTLLGTSNIVLVSCTLTDETRGLLRGRLHHLLASSILVSIAPWEILDPVEVVRALVTNKLRAAAFDDWPCDYMSGDTIRLRSTGRLTITPHIAGSTLDARAATQRFVEEEMKTWLGANPV